MARLRLAWRVSLIVVAALVALQLVALALFYRERNNATETGLRQPLPDQVAALVTLFDAVPREHETLLLRAVNSTDQHVAIVEGRPAWLEEGDRMPLVEATLHRYLRDGDRYVAARLIDSPGSPGRGFERISRLIGEQVRVAVGLADGRTLTVETAGELTARIWGLPSGFFAGIAGFMVAALAVLLLVRETRPLARLSRSVERFAAALQPEPMPERGAPDVRTLIRAYNRMQSRIANLVRGRTFVIGAISHDLRTYLTRLRLRVELLPEPDARARAIRDVEDMQDLVEDTLAFARATLDAGDGAPVDLARIAAHEAEARIATGRPVTLLPFEGDATLVGSATALGRVTGNLIDNALTYGGSAEVAVSASAAAVVLTVADRGPGVPKAQREAIFEPFHRVETSRNRDLGGVGLGLAIARQVVEGHGGTIAVEDRPGGGALFRVTLPRGRIGPA